MLEGKSKDISLIRLRADLARYAPDVADRFGVTAADAADEPDRMALDAERDVDEGAG